MPKCKDCGQPMLPKGAVKNPNEYDHAQGCPSDGRDPRSDPKAGDVLRKRVVHWRGKSFVIRQRKVGQVKQFQSGATRIIGIDFSVLLPCWRRWAKDSKVIHRAD